MTDPEDYGPADSILDGIDDEQAEEIIDEVGDRLVYRLTENNPSGLIDNMQESITSNLPLLRRSSHLRDGVSLVVDPFFEDDPEAVVKATGRTVVDQIREDQAEEVVEDIIRTTVEKMQENRQ